jgi:heme O synthase-like polyprenyltransferase
MFSSFYLLNHLKRHIYTKRINGRNRVNTIVGPAGGNAADLGFRTVSGSFTPGFYVLAANV